MVGPITTSVHPDGPRPFTLEPGQHHQAAAVLTASHADYPAFKSVFPDRPRRVRALRPFFATTVRDAIRYGTVDGCAVDRRLSGVAAWLPPGRFPWTPSRKLRATGAMLRVAVASPSSFARFVRYGANAEKSHPAEPHWYLVVLGVRPDAQRLGIGTRLWRETHGSMARTPGKVLVLGKRRRCRSFGDGQSNTCPSVRSARHSTRGSHTPRS